MAEWAAEWMIDEPAFYFFHFFDQFKKIENVNLSSHLSTFFLTEFSFSY